MKRIAILVSALCLSLSAGAFAQDVAVSTEKFSCTREDHTKVFDASGKEISDFAPIGKMSEGTRTKWVLDGVTYKFTDSLNYSLWQSANGPWTAEASSRSKSMAKLVRAEKDGVITYTGEKRTVKMYLKDHGDEKKLAETTTSIEETDVLVDGQEIPLKSVINGKEETLWFSNFTTTQTSDTTRTEVETYQVPHYEYDAAKKEMTVTLKYVETCTYEKVAE